MAFRRTIVIKLLLSALALIAVTLLILDFYLTRYTAARERDAVARQLAAEGRVLAGELEAVAPPQLESWALTAQRRAQARITIIDPGGRVLAESQHDPESMENHGTRPEVRQAREGRVGFSIRHSATLDRELAYAALPLTYGGGAGYVLRLAQPLEELDTSITAVRRRILAASVAAAAAALAMAWFFSRSFTRRVRRLQAFAEELPAARGPVKLAADGNDELGALAGSLSRAAAHLNELVDKLSLESDRREAILAGMAEGVLAVDNDLRVTFCNQAFAAAAGAPFPLPEGMPALELVRDPAFVGVLGRVLVTRQSIRDRVQLAPAQGRWYELQAAPLSLHSRRGALVILHDITELERLERVRKDFVANVSHELRTPLTAIRGYAETLLDGALEDPENNRRFLEIIRSHAVRLNNIASDLLVLSELDSPHAAAEPAPVSVRAAFEAALRTVEAEAKVRGVTLRAGPLEEAEVVAHRIRLEQAFVNLLDNAVKFNRPGGEVAAEVRRARGMVRVVISDTGIGIPAEDLPRIFERFYRVDKARSREVGGTGLGLSIVKHVIERIGGSISVTSELGKGSTFTVELPAA